MGKKQIKGKFGISQENLCNFNQREILEQFERMEWEKKYYFLFGLFDRNKLRLLARDGIMQARM